MWVAGEGPTVEWPYVVSFGTKQSGRMSRRSDASWCRGNVFQSPSNVWRHSSRSYVSHEFVSRANRPIIVNPARSSARDLATTWRVLRATNEKENFLQTQVEPESPVTRVYIKIYFCLGSSVVTCCNLSQWCACIDTLERLLSCRQPHAIY